MQVVEFQFAIFGEFATLVPTSDRIKNLMDKLPGFIPGTLQSVNFNLINGQMESQQRIQMVNSATNWRIDVQLDRVSAVYLRQDSGTVVNDIERLAGYGASYLQKTAEALGISIGKRLGMVSRYLQPNGKQMPPLPFGLKTPACFPDEKSPSEWTLNMNYHGIWEQSRAEEVNEMLIMNSAVSKSDQTDYAIMVLIDINTSQFNLLERFAIEDVQAFVKYAVPRIQEISKSVGGKV